MCRVPSHPMIASLAILGTYSYSIYLWHMGLMYGAIPMLREVGITWHVRTTIYLVGAIVIGIVMAKLLELPTIRLRDRWFPSRSGDATVMDLRPTASPQPALNAA